MTDFQRTPREPGPQPDPMLDPGPRSRGWLWFVALAIVAVVFGTLYGINNQDTQTATNEAAAPQTTGQSTAPQSPVSGGRGTAAAPPEQQAQDQSGKSSTSGQGGETDQNNDGKNNKSQQAPKQQ